MRGSPFHEMLLKITPSAAWDEAERLCVPPEKLEQKRTQVRLYHINVRDTSPSSPRRRPLPHSRL